MSLTHRSQWFLSREGECGIYPAHCCCPALWLDERREIPFLLIATWSFSLSSIQVSISSLMWLLTSAEKNRPTCNHFARPNSLLEHALRAQCCRADSRSSAMRSMSCIGLWIFVQSICPTPICSILLNRVGWPTPVWLRIMHSEGMH